MTPDDVDEDAATFPAPAAVLDIPAFYRAMHGQACRQISSRVEWITPKIAAGLLERNDHNRPLSDGFAKRYAALIREGQWRVNGQGIIRDKDGSLLDGQHRLNGVVLADIAVPMLIIEGVDKDTFDTIDQGRKRDFAGYLAINGEKMACTLAAAVKWLLWYESKSDRSLSSLTKANSPTITMLFSVLDLHPGVRDSVAVVAPNKQRSIIIPGPMSFLHYLTTRRHPGEKAAEFWRQILTGAGLVEKSPAFILRKQLVDNSVGTKRYTPVTMMALTIKAFNATVAGKRLVCLKYASEEEPFPEVA